MLVACGGQTAENQDVVTVNYELFKLEPQTREVNYAFPATLKGEKDVSLFPQVEGRIVECHYKNGDFVKTGQPLVSIDSTPYRLKVESDEANVRAAEAALSTTKLHFESQKKLFEKKIVSEYVMKTAENDYLTAQAELAQAKAALSYSKTDLSHCTLVAPISGVVTNRKNDIGLLVSPSMPEPILTITDQRNINASFSITEDTYTEIFRSGHLTVGTKGLEDKEGKTVGDIFNNLQLRTKDGILYDKTGTMNYVSGIVDTQTGTVRCEVKFPNPDLILHAGNSASVIFPDKLENVLVIPQTACKKLQNKYLVFKVNAQGEAEGVVVDVVPTDDGKEYILTGNTLKAGDEIVAAGVDRIQEGQRVK